MHKDKISTKHGHISNTLPATLATRHGRFRDSNGASTESLRPHISQTDREWLNRFTTYVWQHYADNTLSVPGLAREFAMSESTLLRQLKRLKGLSPVQYIQEVRLGAARHLLENRVYNSIGKVVSKVGYEDARSFSRCFRARFGKLPSELLAN